jgi:hypothetical protein
MIEADTDNGAPPTANERSIDGVTRERMGAGPAARDGLMLLQNLSCLSIWLVEETLVNKNAFLAVVLISIYFA